MNYEVKMIEPEPAIVTTVSGVAVLVYLSLNFTHIACLKIWQIANFLASWSHSKVSANGHITCRNQLGTWRRRSQMIALRSIDDSRPWLDSEQLFSHVAWVVGSDKNHNIPTKHQIWRWRQRKSENLASPIAPQWSFWYILTFSTSHHTKKFIGWPRQKKQGVSVSNCQIARTTKHNVEKMETSRMVRSRAILNRLTWNLNRVDSMI